MKTYTNTLLILLFLVTICDNIKAQRITVTLAGNGTIGYSGDWGAAKSGILNLPMDICMDAMHNIYFVDQANNRVRKISVSNGLISTVAGGGLLKIDGIVATNAILDTPAYMCIDTVGNLFVSTATQIKRIDAVTGIITTIAGTSLAGYGGDGGPANLANLNSPLGICMDNGGNMYIVDRLNFRIRKINASTGKITTIAGVGLPGYSGNGFPAYASVINNPVAIAVNAAGDVFFSDQNGYYVREIKASTSIISNIAGNGGTIAAAHGGPATSTAIGEIQGIHVDGAGDLYFDDGSCSCTKVIISTGLIFLEAGSLSVDGYNGDDLNSLSIDLNGPGGLWVDESGSIYMADTYNFRIRKAIQLTHTPSFAFGRAQSINVCVGSFSSLDSQLTITDIDSAQVETWTVISAPLHGTLSGFPVTQLSFGTYSVATPSGLSYLLSGSYSGLDSFRVRVSDGLLSDTVTIYVSSGSGTISGANSDCAGFGVALGDAIPGGSWTSLDTMLASVSTSGLFTGLHSGSDTVIYTISNSCGLATSEKVITIDAAPPSNAGTITGATSICIDSIVILSESVASGTWSVLNSCVTITNSGIIKGISTGMANILYSVSNSCGTINTIQQIEVDDCSAAGISIMSSLEPVIIVYPNPVSSILSIEWKSLPLGKASIHVIDVTGSVLLRNEITICGNGVGKIELDVSHLKEGMYLLSIISDHSAYTDKILISK